MDLRPPLAAQWPSAVEERCELTHFDLPDLYAPQVTLEQQRRRPADTVHVHDPDVPTIQKDEHCWHGGEGWPQSPSSGATPTRRAPPHIRATS
jgi:hypothetical protein